LTVSATLAARPVTLDQLVALCDEIASLARAGVPLDRGLAALARDMPGRIGRLAGELGRRLEGGEDLARIVAGSPDLFPPAYQAVITAGLRSGHLAAALEDVARTARRIRNLRSTIGVALVYPLVVLLVAWGLLNFTVVTTLPVMLRVLRDVNLGIPEWEQTFGWLAQTAGWWGPIIPLAIMFWLAIVWFWTGQAAAGAELHPLLAWGALGTLRRMQRAGHMAAVTELLALLVAHGVPLDEAVELASAAVGSKRLVAGGRELAERIRRGEVGGRPPAGFSPLLAWALVTGSRQGNLAPLLHRTAQTYRDQFNRHYRWLEVYVPLVSTALIGGGIVIGYGVVSLGPWILVMHRLADPLSR
jgi:type II secretory pathway component PulF